MFLRSVLLVENTCRQFPVHLAFSMTINKSQGQSVDNIGLDLRTDVFAHGQLYVALEQSCKYALLSRCTSRQRVKALFKKYCLSGSVA
ncbi:hypothetical protein DFH06DRAFT_1173459 [Mycena polygramma]|nr:hypothetical protein DFH06DRAFT_1173459 [Mycena polygramma]